jgi:hypothetical protein
LTPQKPLKKAYAQDPLAVTHWLQAEYPAIAARAHPALFQTPEYNLCDRGRMILI